MVNQCYLLFFCFKCNIYIITKWWVTLYTGNIPVDRCCSVCWLLTLDTHCACVCCGLSSHSVSLCCSGQSSIYFKCLCVFPLVNWQMFRIILLLSVLFLAHLSWKVKLALTIACCSSSVVNIFSRTNLFQGEIIMK